MDERELEVARMTRTIWIIWGAFLTAGVLYLAVGYLITQGRRSAPLAEPEYLNDLRTIFYALAGILLLGGFWLRRRLMNRAHSEPTAALIGAQAAMVVGWALSETVAILGLALVLLGGRWQVGLPFIGLAFVAIVLQRPETERLRSSIDAIH